MKKNLFILIIGFIIALNQSTNIAFADAKLGLAAGAAGAAAAPAIGSAASSAASAASSALSSATTAASSASTAATAASGATTAASGAANAAGSVAGETGSLQKLQNFFDSPMGILTISGIATVYSGILYKGAAKQEEESTANVKKIDTMIASFKDSYSGYCPNGRDTMAEPSCYCYTDAGKKNSTRTNSQTCIDLWAKTTYKLSGDATNYGIGTATEAVGCVNLAGDFDETCKCKKFVDAKGVNACKKEASITLASDTFSTGFATSTGVSDILKYTANSTNGNPRFDLLGTGNLTANALRAKQVTNKLLNNLQAKDKNTQYPKIDETNAGKYAAALIGQNNIDNGMKGSSAAMNVASSRSDNPAVENILKAAQAKAGLEISGGKGLDAKKGAKKNNMNLNFNDSGSVSAGQVIQGFPETPEKTYKYKNSDISTNESASIFEIISNRYVQSGLKRLFED